MATIAQPDNQLYEKQIIRFGNQGLNLSVPPELVPIGQYVVFNDVVTNRDGTVQCAGGGALLVVLGGAHSVKRFEDQQTGDAFYIFGSAGTLSQVLFDGTTSAIDTGFSGNPMTMVEYHVAVLSNPYMLVADINKMVKVDGTPTATKVGIIRPIPFYGQAGIVPVASGAGLLVGDYDWRYTFCRIIGTTVVAESNPSDVGTTITLASEQADVPVVASDPAQGTVTNIRLWRRGGTLPDAWRLITTLANATATYTDNTPDTDISSADIMPFDNDVPVTSVDSSGVTLVDQTAVPLPYIWGPLEETIFGCGDPNRLDVVYWTKQGWFESWPAENTLSLDTPSDPAVNGFIYDGKSHVFTQEALYSLIPNILDGRTWTPFKTPCGRGVIGPFAFCVGGGSVFFCGKDGVYQWDGAGESVRISDGIRPLFPYKAQAGYSVFGYNPIVFTTDDGDIAPVLTVRMTYHNNEVWLHYDDSTDTRCTMVYSPEEGSWRSCVSPGYNFTYSDEGPETNLLGMLTNSNVIRSDSVSLPGDTAQSPSLYTGGHDQGFPRADKEYGDCAIWADCAGGSIDFAVYFNSDLTTPVFTQTLTGSGLTKYTVDIGGLYGRIISYSFDWDATTAIQPSLYWIETSYIPRPEEIIDRMTDWDDLGHPADKSIKGLLLTADTNNQPITIQVLYDDNVVGATFTIGPDASGVPRVYNIGFAAFTGRKVRLLPTSTTEWKFYGINKWLFDAEPESIECHDVYWGDAGYAHDKLIKGMTIEADCEGIVQTLNVFDDSGVLQETISLGPGIDGIPNIYEFSWDSFRTRNIRIMECSSSPIPPCEGGDPTITNLNPSTATAGDSDTPLVVTGTNFRSDSQVTFNGTPLTVTFISSTELDTTIPAALLVAEGTFDVVVNNPPPGCGPSSPFEFEVTEPPSASMLRLAAVGYL